MSNDEAVRLARTVIKANEAGDCISMLAGVRLAHALLDLHAENERLASDVADLRAGYLPASEPCMRLAAEAGIVGAHDTLHKVMHDERLYRDQLRAGLKEALPRIAALERLFAVARILETFGPYENCSELERVLREAVKGVNATGEHIASLRKLLEGMK